MEVSMPRLFIGLEIPDDLRQTLSLLRGGLPGARWIDPENYHLTLRFIGDIDGGLAHEIVSMLGGVNRRPFDVRLDGLSSFGGKKPRAIVASVAPSPSLLDWQATRGVVRSAAFRAERFVLYSSRASVGGGPYVIEDAFALEEPSRVAMR
jgi:2'-5' RNA ligase